MRCDADFDGARPLVHHLVDANLEHLIGAQRPAAQDHAVVEVISRAVDGVLLDFKANFILHSNKHYVFHDPCETTI